MGRLAEEVLGELVQAQHEEHIARYEAQRRQLEAAEPKKALTARERELEKIAREQRRLTRLTQLADTRNPQ